ncbi:MAG: 23S rRNA pseudouridine(955/2504/2580) synthase RluC [Gammaproteobacteria bacterium]|nr:23S rRNA pseudouridine(955/2504/2580) synthase RluC [Gammaproteobacteria bacterium]
MNKVSFITIDEAHAGQRLDNFLISHLKGVPKSRIYRLLRKGEVRVNKARCKPDYRLELDDELRIPPIRVADAAPRPAHSGKLEWLEAAIIYEDDVLIAMNKPSGLAVHGGSGVSLGLIEALRQLRPEARFLELVHRLDRETSGLLLVAKKRSALLALHEQLRGTSVDKRYLALVKNPWQGKARMVEAPLLRSQTRSGERMVRVSEEGKVARSRIVPQQLFRGATLVEVRIYTGRTHQVRVHCAHEGHPIAGDDKYGDRGFNKSMAAAGLKRLFLHAARMHLTHPVTGKPLELDAPLPDDLVQVLDTMS